METAISNANFSQRSEAFEACWAHHRHRMTVVRLAEKQRSIQSRACFSRRDLMTQSQ